MTRPDTREDILTLAIDAMEDAAAGMRYVRQHYGDLSGVGFDRVQEKYLTVVGKLRAAPTPPAAEAPGQEPVVVKPLEWVEDADGWSANTVAGLYEFGLVHSGYSVVRRTVTETGNLDDEVLGRRLDFDAAKAAAQADYEQRIRSALVSAPPTYADAEAKGWQTMDSAPLDGSRVDLWLDWPAYDEKPARQERSPDAYYDAIEGDWTLRTHYSLGMFAAQPKATHWRLPPAGPAAIRSLASPAPKGET